jgi:hypothetical protein
MLLDSVNSAVDTGNLLLFAGQLKHGLKKIKLSKQIESLD